MENQEQLEIEKLIQLDEGERLDFKREVDLESKRGKADFLVEFLGLANSPEKPAYLVLGIDDKTKKVVGIKEDITEERLQKFVNDNLNKPLRFTYKIYLYKRKNVGLIVILGNNRPYTLKKDLSYEDEREKQHYVSDKQVFVRQGSTGAIASPEEIIEMAIKPVDDSENINEPYTSSEITDELNDISSAIYKLGRRMEGLYNARDRSIECAFVGIASGIVIGFLQLTGWQYALLISPVLSIIINVILSALRIVDLGLLRSIIVGFIVGMIFFMLSQFLDDFVAQKFFINGSLIAVFLLWGSIKGVIGGFVAHWLINRFEMSA